MNVSVRANARVAEAGRGGIARRSTSPSAAARSPACSSSASRSSASPATTASLTWIFDDNQKEAVDALIGLGFGGSLISVFARLGGGIFTKAADVGADLVGKIEAGIPEDDPRNPAVIADNVGDNVGDCAGMAADLFETYAVTAVAVMLLGVLIFRARTPRGRAVPAGARRRRDHRVDHRHVRRASATGNVERALYQGLIVSGVIAAAAFYPVTNWLMDDLTSARRRARRRRPVGDGALALLARSASAVTALLFVITDYYTSTRFSPGEDDGARLADRVTRRTSSRASPRACRRRRCPRSCSCSASSAAEASWPTGIYGIGVAVMGQLSLTGLIVALDAFGPITDNAGGIAEMADMPEEVRNVTDPLDAVGNTTKAVTKGYAIGSAVLAALVLFAGFQHRAAATSCGHDVLVPDRRPAVLIGLLHRRPDGLPVRRALDGGRRPRRRRRRRGGAPPVPREAGDHGGHRQPDYARVRRHRHARPRSAR